MLFMSLERMNTPMARAPHPQPRARVPRDTLPAAHLPRTRARTRGRVRRRPCAGNECAPVLALDLCVGANISESSPRTYASPARACLAPAAGSVRASDRRHGARVLRARGPLPLPPHRTRTSGFAARESRQLFGFVAPLVRNLTGACFEKRHTHGLRAAPAGTAQQCAAHRAGLW